MNSPLLEKLRQTSPFSGANAAYVEQLYEEYLLDPDSIDPGWRKHFDALSRGSATADTPHSPIRQQFAEQAKAAASAVPCKKLTPDAAEKQVAVLRLINAYRVRGHQNASLDPLKLRELEILDELTPEYHHLLHSDMHKVFHTGSLYAPSRLPLNEIIDFLKEVYTQHSGFEYMHITSTEEKRWLQKRIEGYRARPVLDADDRIWLLKLLTAAEGLERYLHSRYVGQKRFSLEGGESLIPLLDELIQRAGKARMEEIVIGMAHRGRLNVLTNIVGKSPCDLFDEFEGKKESHGIIIAGDVKYHMGFSADIETSGHAVHVALGFNPSHLEIISPVIEGSVRARQMRRMDFQGDKVLPVLLHGDASFSGQGVVMETLQLSQARGFSTGGTVHIVINNQIGFTVSNPLDSRSTAYCTDVGKMVQAPVFHVNGDDPEAVIFITRLAMDYRNTFHKDVIIDLVCYRRLGHNEADEPAVTQPMMYDKIRNHATARTLYAESLIAADVITPNKAHQMVSDYRDALDQGEIVSRPVIEGADNPYAAHWREHKGFSWTDVAETSVDSQLLAELGMRQLELPRDFIPHSRINRLLESRRRMAEGELLADWGYAENLAYASLLHEGHNVRLCGQDSGRGTFFHRHAILHNQRDGSSYVPLKQIAADGANFTIIDSLLSEEAVLGFEYGYAAADPETLVIWEAQFGDFANVAQVVIDQFITSGGTKWGLSCNITLLLPHGQEGQGAEHSSARLERFLQLSAENNIQVCVPTTPAQIFHLLRRQVIRPSRIPLIALTPKSLLRHPLATSPIHEFSEGGFQPVIDEIDPIDPAGVKRVIACCGKVYYELLEARRSRELTDTAIIRIEELYPFPRDCFAAATRPFVNAKALIWCQEEPQNQGAWDQIKHRLVNHVANERHLYYVGRCASAAPATGYHPMYEMQQETLVDDALCGNINPKMNRRVPS
ncbi:MAG: 2-oxoglutarate dehydrogenase E1 component [Gammaproteobacteria bacterium]|nr:2-oxoglutarate dehydrogenase E1 component [Gammaproteobacteria bacterium]